MLHYEWNPPPDPNLWCDTGVGHCQHWKDMCGPCCIDGRPMFIEDMHGVFCAGPWNPAYGPEPRQNIDKVFNARAENHGDV